MGGLHRRVAGWDSGDNDDGQRADTAGGACCTGNSGHSAWGRVGLGVRRVGCESPWRAVLAGCGWGWGGADTTQPDSYREGEAMVGPWGDPLGADDGGESGSGGGVAVCCDWSAIVAAPADSECGYNVCSRVMHSVFADALGASSCGNGRVLLHQRQRQLLCTELGVSGGGLAGDGSDGNRGDVGAGASGKATCE